MRRPMMWFLVIALVLASARDSNAHDPMDVSVRLYASDAASAASPRAIAIATTILGEAGVRVTWTLCGSGGRGEIACDSPMHSTELAVRLIVCDVGLAGHRGAVGYALIDTQHRSGTLATLDVDRVAALARESRIDSSVLLGRAIAHEIGHLLMGTIGHSDTGLMRALWSRQDLRRGRPDAWRFTPMEIAAMRDRRGPIVMARR